MGGMVILDNIWVGLIKMINLNKNLKIKTSGNIA